MAHGGKREPGPGKRIGRPRNPVKDIAGMGPATALRALKEIDAEKQIVELYFNCGDPRLKTHIIFKLRDDAYGKPTQRQEDRVVFDPDQPLRVVIEHIGRSADKAAAQTK